MNSFKYTLIKKIRLYNIVIAVFVQEQCLHLLSDIEGTSTKVKFMGLVGSKGAATIRFDFAGVSVCCVNSHLTAHQFNVKSRVNDYNLITSIQQFKVILNISKS